MVSKFVTFILAEDLVDIALKKAELLSEHYGKLKYHVGGKAYTKY